MMLSFVKTFYSITDKHPKQEALDVLHIRPRSRLREDFLRLADSHVSGHRIQQENVDDLLLTTIFVTVFVRRAPVKDNTADSQCIVVKFNTMRTCTDAICE